MNTNLKTTQSAQTKIPSRSIVQSIRLPMLIKAAGTFASFVLSITLARMLGISEFGTYSLVVSTVMVLSIPIGSGIQTLATRETSRALEGENLSAIGYMYKWSSRIIHTYTFVVSGIVLSAWLVTGQSQFLDGLLVAIVTVGSLSLTLRNSAILRGFESFSKGTSPDILIRPIGQLAMLAMLLFVIAWPGATALVGLFSFTAASILACIVSALWVRREFFRVGDVWGSVESTLMPWRKSLLFLTVAGGGQILFGHIDTLMLGALGEPEQVGAYRASVQISMLLIFVITVVNQVLQPNLVRLYLLKDMNGMQRLVSDTSFYVFLATLALGALLLIFAAPLIGLTFGSSYTIAATALQILVIGQVMNVFFGSVGTILNMTGMEKEAMISIFIAIIINIILDILLIPLFGLIGAASASAISILVWNMISRHYVKARIGIESSGVIHRLKHFVF